MGLSISASAAIIFIASAIVFGTLLGAFTNAEHAMLDAQREAQTRAVEETNTHLAISSINTDNGTVAITNEGDITLSIGKIDLFIDGVLSNDRIIVQNDRWDQGRPTCGCLERI